MADKKRAKKWRKILLTLAFIAINVGVIVATAVNEFGNSKTAAELSEVKINWWLLIPATLCFVGMIGLEYWKYIIMLRRLTKPGTFTRGEAFKVAFNNVMLGRYYDKVTPASIGGQPFQIYELTKLGKLSHGLAAAIPIFSMISGQVALLLISIICFVLGGATVNNAALMSLAWIGLLFYAFWPVLVFGMAFLPKPTTRVLQWFARVLARLKIVKNREKALGSIETEIGDYAKCVRRILKTPAVFWGVMAMSLMSNFLISLVPYYVLTAFGGDVGFWPCLVLTMAVSSAIYFVPTPGNSGAAEGTFYMVFSALSSGYVFWAMLVWRFFSFYIYIIVGPLIYLRRQIEKRKKRRSVV